jgi:hypothetical protein
MLCSHARQREKKKGRDNERETTFKAQEYKIFWLLISQAASAISSPRNMFDGW